MARSNNNDIGTVAPHNIIRVSTYPIVEAEQTSTSYFTRIHKEYVERKPKDLGERTLQCFETRIKLMLKEFVKFLACYKNLLKIKKSGTTADEQ